MDTLNVRHTISNSCFFLLSVAFYFITLAIIQFCRFPFRKLFCDPQFTPTSKLCAPQFNPTDPNWIELNGRAKSQESRAESWQQQERKRYLLELLLLYLNYYYRIATFLLQWMHLWKEIHKKNWWQHVQKGTKWITKFIKYYDQMYAVVAPIRLTNYSIGPFWITMMITPLSNRIANRMFFFFRTEVHCPKRNDEETNKRSYKAK